MRFARRARRATGSSPANSHLNDLVRAPRGLVGPVDQSGKALGLVPPEPPVDGLARDVEPVRDLDDRNTIADDREHCLVPLLHDTQLPQHAGSVTDQVEPVSPITRSHVTQHPEPMCHASGGTKHRICAPGRNRTSDTRFRNMLQPLHPVGLQNVDQESCRAPMVLMDQSAQNIAASDLRPGDRLEAQSGIGRLKLAAPMRPGH